MSFLSPTLDFNQGAMSKIPVIICEAEKEEIIRIAGENVSICKEEWDTHETSWDFKRNSLIPESPGKNELVEHYFNTLTYDREKNISILRRNEETINRIFINTYGLSEQLDDREDKDSISINSIELHATICGLISYAVGCMFGRYSLDVEGLVYAGGDWRETFATKYKTFMPDTDAIIPITDEEYFKDDIVARFVDFIRIVYGEETLEVNLKFIADALGNKGDTPRAVIRNYFLNDFYKDHCNTYSATGSGKRPIYWLFDSGKQNGFKALIYIHRYTPDTVGLIRSVYLHNAQAAIQNSLQNSEYIISTTTSATERARETRKKDKYVKQLNELRPYYQALSHIALQRIPMDLDDGVKKNYQLFQGVEVSAEGKKKQTIDLLAKL